MDKPIFRGLTSQAQNHQAHFQAAIAARSCAASACPTRQLNALKFVAPRHGNDSDKVMFQFGIKKLVYDYNFDFWRCLVDISRAKGSCSPTYGFLSVLKSLQIAHVTRRFHQPSTPSSVSSVFWNPEMER